MNAPARSGIPPPVTVFEHLNPEGSKRPPGPRSPFLESVFMHFTVMVVCPADTTPDNVHERLEQAMAPFNECVDAGDEFAVFHDVTEECRIQYEQQGTERVAMPDGRLLLPWDEEFRIEGTFGVGNRGTHEAPAELQKRIVPYSETYPTLEAFMSDWHGYRYHADHGAYGYYHNPRGKWDWWQLGGRWQDMLTTKPGVRADSLIYGEPGVFGSRG